MRLESSTRFVALGPHLRELRVTAGYTLEQLAEISGISDRAISDIERGISRRPRRSTLEALAVSLKLSQAQREELSSSVRAGALPSVSALSQSLHFPRIVPDFTGRKEELAFIAAALGEGLEAYSPFIVVTGPPGIGKTSVALQAAMDSDFHTDDIFYVDLEGAGPTPLPPDHVAGLLVHAICGLRPDAIEAIGYLHQMLRQRRIFLILDNAADEPQVRELLPPHGASAIVVTSRSTLAGLSGARRVSLESLTGPESLELLQKIIPSQESDNDELTVLARLCADVPLALRIAGNQIASRAGWTVATLIDRLAAEESRLETLSAGDLQIKAAFELAYSQLRPVAQRVFRRLGLIDGVSSGVPLAAVLTTLSIPEVQGVLDELVDLSLVQYIDTDRYRLHDLLRLFAQEKLLDEDRATVEQVRAVADSYLLQLTASAGALFEPVDYPRYEAKRLKLVADVSFASEGEAEAWLITEVDHWNAALRRAFKRDEHRQVVATVQCFHWFSKIWMRSAPWHEIFELAAKSAKVLDDWPELSHFYGETAWFRLALFGEAEASASFVARAQEAANHAPDLGPQGWVHYFHAKIHLKYGEYTSAVLRAIQARECFEQEGLTHGVIFANQLHAQGTQGLGNLDHALAELRHVLQLTQGPSPGQERLAWRLGRANAKRLMTEIHCQQRLWSQAVCVGTEALVEFESLGQQRLIIGVRLHRGIAFTALGRRASAKEDFSAAEALSIEIGEAAWASTTGRLLALVTEGNIDVADDLEKMLLDAQNRNMLTAKLTR